MARQIFINESHLKEIKKELFSKDWKVLSNSDFVSSCHSLISTRVEEIIKKSLSPDECSKLCYLGSFSRNEACPESDLDLLYLGKEKEASVISDKLRPFFRKYSVKFFPDEISSENTELSDSFGVLSVHWARPVFGQKPPIELENLKRKLSKLDENRIISDLMSDRFAREQRFGKQSGKLSYNIKNSKGGLKDSLQAMWYEDLKAEAVSDRILDQRHFLLKLRTINYFLGFYDNLNLSLGSEYIKFFSYEDEISFFKRFYDYTKMGQLYSERAFNPVSEKVLSFDIKSTDSVRLCIENEIEEFSRVKGLVQSPSYHTWTVDEHLLQAHKFMNQVIEEEREYFNLSVDEEDVLRWASLFHDIKKGTDKPHSIDGAEFVQAFGKKKGWSEEKTELISWLVREHLSLSKFAFKDNPYSDESVKRLYFRGVEKRRAVLLCLLTEADIKATNLASWSQWKKDMLRGLLNRLLKKESLEKEELLKTFKEDKFAVFIVNSLSSSEVSSIPQEFLSKDLKSFDEKKQFCFFEKENRIWLRFFQKEDEPGLAYSIISKIYSAGGFVHRAHFKTLSDNSVYNWFCIETGVSMGAFEKRFHAAKEKTPKKVQFTRIRKTFSDKNSAVISFKGKDQEGMLLVATHKISALGLDIRWGHAVTWGDEVEDVFGVQFETEPDWSKLELGVNA